LRARKFPLKAVGYLSAEFLIGPQLGNNLLNVHDIHDAVATALSELELSLDKLVAHEPEPGLGNGGLGRLAACYLESLTTLNIPAIGYGIRYEFGLFHQDIHDGWQLEKTDKWLSLGDPWEITRPEICHYVGNSGYTEPYHDEQGRFRVRWIPEYVIKGIANDIAVAGYGTSMTNFLRLWSSEAIDSFDFQAFNKGDYYDAVREKVASETISKALYPNDEPEAGKILRLQQQYFFTSCSLQDMIRIHKMRGGTIDSFHEAFVIQLNDTHPSIAVAELMRLLLDMHGMDWDNAWNITRRRWRTPITRCCQKPWKSGRCRCSPSCCPVISRSFTKSTVDFSMMFGQNIQATTTVLPGFRSLTSITRNTCAWPTSPPSGRTRSLPALCTRSLGGPVAAEEDNGRLI
jgi:glycogen phosphorylase